jgi:hypothetical protein
MQHGNTLLDGDDLKAPCIIAPPGAPPAPRRIENLLSAADHAPTLLRLLRRPVPPGMSGTAFLDEAGRPAVGAPRTVYLETGEWFQTGPPADEDALPYPAVDQLLDTDASGHLVIRDRYRDLVEIAKQRGVFDGVTLLRYLPRRGGARIELSDLDGRTPPAAARGGEEQPAVRDRLARKLAELIGALPGARLDPKTRLLEFRFEQE